MKPSSALLLLFFCLSIATSFFLGTTSQAQAQSSGLENLRDTISSNLINEPDVVHSVSFRLPSTAQTVSPTDYIQIELVHFTNVTAPTLVAGDVSGTPSFSASGNRARVTGITLLPGKTITIEGATATNPATIDDFQVQVFISDDADGNFINNQASTIATQTQGTVNISAEVDNPTARIQISGYTAPNSIAYFTEGDTVAGTDLTASVGTFSKLFPATTPGYHYFSVFSIDQDDLDTSVVNLSIYAPVYQTTTVSNILLSPSITINSSSVVQGDTLIASGSAYPGSAITLFTDSPIRSYSASASAVGAWTYSITDTADYNPGDYRIYALAQSNSLQSLFSPSLLFTITTTSGGGGGSSCGDISQGDLNCDDIVNLTDFSILMYYWGTTNATADINTDGNVDLTDFSIMMYYWGT